jgi:putative flavoprotein involved in K+ transport
MGSREMSEEAIVVGAGAAGLATAATLERAGVGATVLERSDEVASSWRTRYDSLRLNTPRLTSTLPIHRMPRSMGRWPSAKAMVAYLDEYARRLEVSIRFGTELERIERANGDWRLVTSKGDLRARAVVIATGHDTHPHIPDWPGRDSFTGELLQAASYRRPDPYVGRDVLVVGPSTTGSEIAYELATKGAKRVRVAMRNAPPIFPREWPPGMPLNYSACTLDRLPNRVADRITQVTQRMIYGDLSQYGLPRPRVGAQTRTRQLHQGSTIDAGFVEAVKAGWIEIVEAVASFDGGDVVLASGERVQPDVVIAATGYQRGLNQVAGHLGILDEAGFPRVIGGKAHPQAPRLYFNGFRAAVSGQLRFMRKDARAIARAVARELNGRARAE